MSEDLVPSEELMPLYDAYGAVAVAEAARSLGIVSLLSEQPHTADEVAEALALSPKFTGIVLATLAELQVVHVERDGRYTAAPMALAMEMMHYWEGVGASLRTGTPPVRCDDPDEAQHVYPRSVRMMAAFSGLEAEQLADHLLDHVVDDSKELHVLEVGAGAATWSLALVQRAPGYRVTALDLPAVLTETRRVVRAAGHEDRYDFVAADVFVHDLPPQRFDLVLVPNVCHLFGAERNIEMFGRLRETLRPGGTLAVVDITPDDRRSRERVLYTLSLALRTSEGGVHTVAEYRHWLRSAGFPGGEQDMAFTRFAGRHGFTLLTARSSSAPANVTGT